MTKLIRTTYPKFLLHNFLRYIDYLVIAKLPIATLLCPVNGSHPYPNLNKKKLTRLKKGNSHRDYFNYEENVVEVWSEGQLSC